MSKIFLFKENKSWLKLDKKNRTFIADKAEENQLSFQDIKQIIDIATDLEAWDEKPLGNYWPENPPENLKNKDLKIFLINEVKRSWENLKNNPTNYNDFTPSSDFRREDINFTTIKEDRTLLGDCPVASDKTRCCNLKTLDAVINCGYDCSYCTIQSFYKGGRVLFEKNLKEKLDKLNLDPEKLYHIGTGQSSDSLMWGNRENTLEHLFYFARKNPNVILELKTKSDNIEYLLQNEVPQNIICTWSINTQTIISNEEHQTASLEKRLTAARKVHDKGILIGFHFHPMVYYNNWKADYKAIAQRIQNEFEPSRTALISIGTLTFIKPVIKQIRNRDFKSKILQMPLVDAEGKYSYPYEIKKEMFCHLYESFSMWHDKVFFYMCMEDKRLWPDVFKREYSSNKEFEKDMIDNYFTKINY